MRRRLAFQSNAATQDASGEPIASWSTAFTLWGRVEAQGGLESRDGDRIAGTRRMTFTTRYRDGVTTLMRISLDGAAWNIHSAEPDERRTQLTITASEVR